MPRKGTAAYARERAAREAKLAAAEPQAPAIIKAKEKGVAARRPKPVAEALSRGFEEKQTMIATPARTGETVTVGCKIPNGIVLQLQTQQEVRYPVMGGGFIVEKQWRPDPNIKTHVLHGNRTPHGEQPKCLIVGGFAMTSGIPADFMDKWMEQNRELDMVKAGLIVVHKTMDGARGMAAEKRDTRSGLEPIHPGKDTRTPKRKARDGKVVDAIETGDEQPKAA